MCDITNTTTSKRQYTRQTSTIDKANINRHSFVIPVSFQQFEAIQKGWKGKWQRYFLFIHLSKSDFLWFETRRDNKMRDCGTQVIIILRRTIEEINTPNRLIKNDFDDIFDVCSLQYFISTTTSPYQTRHVHIDWLQTSQNTDFAENIRAIKEYQSTLDRPTSFFATGRLGSYSGNAVTDRVPGGRQIIWRRHHLETLRYVWILRKPEV